MQPEPLDGKLRQNLNQELVGALRQRILDGTLPDGERINEVLVARELGVSRTPLREALIVLAQEGFVTNQPRRGAFVNDLTAEDFKSLYSIRVLLDPFALNLAGRPSAERFAKLRGINRRMAKATRSVTTTIELDDTWHLRLIDECNNSVLVDLIRGLMLRTRRYEIVYLAKAENVTVAVEEHEEILDALEAGQLSQACELLKNNMASAVEPVLEWLERRSNSKGCA